MDIVSFLALILPIIAGFSVLLIVFINIYLKIRRILPIKVNCWFCNQWTKVHYDQRNSFECPSCLQYNGFDSDGDYNKPIPAQRDELLNQQCHFKSITTNHKFSNGLCHLCNNNQQLKIYQLANFIPLDENNFDKEIEHFQKQLEKAYKLCSPCQHVVNSTISKQNCFLGLNFAKLRSKGLKLLDLNTSYEGISKKSKRFFLKKLISDDNLKNILPNSFYVAVSTMEKFYTAILNNGIKVFQDIFHHRTQSSIVETYENVAQCFLEYPLVGIFVDGFTYTWQRVFAFVNFSFMGTTVLLSSVGAILQFIMLIWNHSYAVDMVGLLLWIFLSSEEVESSSDTNLKLLQLISCFIILIALYMTRNATKLKKKKIRPISHNRRTEEDLGKLSDDEELKTNVTCHNSTFKQDTISTPTTTHIFGQSPVLQNQLINQQLFPSPKEHFPARKYLNNSFDSTQSSINTQDTVSIFNNSLKNPNSSNSLDCDIDLSLNKLNLGTPVIRQKKYTVNPTFYTNNDIARPKPVISPAKFRSVTQNSWVAGGFWRDSNGILMPVHNISNVSRSSSQTSGFVSHVGPTEPNHFNSLPSSANNSICGDFECSSVLSEPTYYMNGSYMVQNRTLPCRNPLTRTYYPILNQELVYIAPYVIANHSMGNNLITNTGTLNLENSNSTFNKFSKRQTNTSFKSDNLLKEWIDKIDL